MEKIGVLVVGRRVDHSAVCQANLVCQALLVEQAFQMRGGFDARSIHKPTHREVVHLWHNRQSVAEMEQRTRKLPGRDEWLDRNGHIV